MLQSFRAFPSPFKRWIPHEKFSFSKYFRFVILSDEKKYHTAHYIEKYIPKLSSPKICFRIYFWKSHLSHVFPLVLFLLSHMRQKSHYKSNSGWVPVLLFCVFNSSTKYSLRRPITSLHITLFLAEILSFAYLFLYKIALYFLLIHTLPHFPVSVCRTVFSLRGWTFFFP